jgi:putative colanic acid biosynthesis UDP-glucose lipid carrier transferase
MFAKRFRLFRLITFIGDVLIIPTSAYINMLLFNDTRALNTSILVFSSIAWAYICFRSKLYNLNRIEGYERVLRNITQALLFLYGLFILIHYTLHFQLMPLFIIISWLVIITFLTFIWHTVLTVVLSYRRSSETHYRKAIVLGNNETGRQINEVLNHYKGYGYRSFGIFDDADTSNNINAARQLIRDQKTEDVFCALPLDQFDKISEIMLLCEEHFINFKIVPDFSSLLQRRLNISMFGFVPVIAVNANPLRNTTNRMIKRVFDLFFSSLVIVIILSWLLPMLALLIKLSSRGPVFYKQNRSGYNYKIFRIYKLRTMTVTEQDQEYKQATVNDDRVTHIGKYLRKWSIDELPQFFNVWLGHMSVVGPRPHPIKLNETYKKSVDRYMSRHNVKPGVTGLAQVRGFRGSTETMDMMENRVKADLNYIENWSLWLDIKIIFLTVANIFKGDDQAI